ncbi:MAG: hypothetical protein RLZZ597_849, partial [Cyanobacteriota bacterium]
MGMAILLVLSYYSPSTKARKREPWRMGAKSIV